MINNVTFILKNNISAFTSIMSTIKFKGILISIDSYMVLCSSILFIKYILVINPVIMMNKFIIFSKTKIIYG